MFTRSLLTRSLQIAVLSTLSCLAVAQQKSRQQQSIDPPGAVAGCAVTYTSGTGHNLTQYCVTTNGNIVQFSRGGDEYISVGSFLEGYGLCDESANVSYYDYAGAVSDNWLSANFSHTAKKATSTRVTSDGIWEITNTISQVAANAAGPGAAKVSMQIRNRTAADRIIQVIRYADADFSRDGVDNFNNDFDYSIDTASALEPGFGTGLSLTTNTFNFEHAAYAQDVSEPPDPCDAFPNIAAQPFVGDGSIAHAYAFEVPANGSKAVVLTYKPI
jgi:hypothetical protein